MAQSLRIARLRNDADPYADPPEGQEAVERTGLAKALVMTGLARVLDEDDAKMATLEASALEPHRPSGEILHLGDSRVTRHVTVPSLLNGS